MKLFEGKTKAERNKIIAAIVLGAACLVVFYFAFIRPMLGPTPAASANSTKRSTPTPSRTGTAADNAAMPTADQQNFEYQTLPITYQPGNFHAPDPGRNIFAFYEPPVPTPYSPTPFVAKPEPPPPTPVPPPVQLAFVMPQNVYAGSKTFRIEVNGDKFTPDMHIYFSQNQLPTTFVSAQKLVADVPASMIAGEGPRQVIVQSIDGRSYSNQVMFSVQAPPRPGFQYIGMIARKRANNDTGYFQEPGKPVPTSARLSDVVGGRFRLLSLSREEAVFEDVNLGFKHRLPIQKNDTSASSSGGYSPSQPANTMVPQYVPPQPYNAAPQPQSIPGIPDNIPRYVPPSGNDTQKGQPKSQTSKDDGVD